MWIQPKSRNNLQSAVEFKSFWERAHKNPNSWLNSKERSPDQSWAKINQNPKPIVWNIPKPWKINKNPNCVLTDEKSQFDRFLSQFERSWKAWSCYFMWKNARANFGVQHLCYTDTVYRKQQQGLPNCGYWPFPVDRTNQAEFQTDCLGRSGPTNLCQ